MKGLILIPDVTGFTNFVKNINIQLGSEIMHELLNEILENNPLQVELSEIEGDALLYYREGKPIDTNELFAGLQQMYNAFEKKYALLKSKYQLETNLSLKFIVHYGELKVYNIKGFKKLFGQTVIESHSLLKNGEGRSNYALITDDYFKALHHVSFSNNYYNWQYTTTKSKLLEGLRNISYYFYNYMPTVAASSFAL